MAAAGDHLRPAEGARDGEPAAAGLRRGLETTRPCCSFQGERPGLPLTRKRLFSATSTSAPLTYRTRAVPPWPVTIVSPG